MRTLCVAAQSFAPTFRSAFRLARFQVRARLMGMSSDQTVTAARIHPFERAGLGKAPFRFVYQFRSVYQAIPGDASCPMQPGSSCDYCANGISEVYVIRSADGREFKVGCDCVAKVAREAATTADEKMAAAVDEARRMANRSKAHARADVVHAELKALLADEAVRAKLSAKPHPAKWRAEQGDTALNWAEWMVKCCGMAGRAKLLKALKSELSA